MISQVSANGVDFAYLSQGSGPLDFFFTAFLTTPTPGATSYQRSPSEANGLLRHF